MGCLDMSLHRIAKARQRRTWHGRVVHEEGEVPCLEAQVVTRTACGCRTHNMRVGEGERWGRLR